MAGGPGDSFGKMTGASRHPPFFLRALSYSASFHRPQRSIAALPISSILAGRRPLSNQSTIDSTTTSRITQRIAAAARGERPSFSSAYANRSSAAIRLVKPLGRAQRIQPDAKQLASFRQELERLSVEHQTRGHLHDQEMRPRSIYRAKTDAHGCVLFPRAAISRRAGLLAPLRELHALRRCSSIHGRSSSPPTGLEDSSHSRCRADSFPPSVSVRRAMIRPRSAAIRFAWSVEISNPLARACCRSSSASTMTQPKSKRCAAPNASRAGARLPNSGKNERARPPDMGRCALSRCCAAPQRSRGSSPRSPHRRLRPHRRDASAASARPG